MFGLSLEFWLFYVAQFSLGLWGSYHCERAHAAGKPGALGVFLIGVASCLAVLWALEALR